MEELPEPMSFDPEGTWNRLFEKTAGEIALTGMDDPKVFERTQPDGTVACIRPDSPPQVVPVFKLETLLQ